MLRRETVGGALLLAAMVAALLWANSPWADTYLAVRDTRFGPAGLKLNLSTAEWAADGLLAIFFFVAGLELKREFVAGDLRDPRRAVLPVAAAVGGMVAAGRAVPGHHRQHRRATRCAAGRSRPPPTSRSPWRCSPLSAVDLPTALRTFLLTLAVVDDLLAITIIAVFYTADLHAWPLLAGRAAAGRVRRARAAPRPLLVAAAAARRGHLGAGARLRRARHRRRRAARVHRPGPRRSAGRGAPGLAEHFEHRLAPALRGRRRARVRLLRRRRHARRTSPGSGPPAPTPSRSASSPGSSSAKPPACSAAPVS